MRIFFLSAVLLTVALANLGCGSKDDANGNSRSNANRGNSNQPPMDVMNQNVSNQNAGNSNANPNGLAANGANAATPPANPDATMNHDMQSAPDAASQPYDLQFIDTMIAHHQAAVLMAKTALEKAQHAELKNLAQNVIRSQTQEIQQMQQWREKWFKNSPPAINMDAAGMRDSMRSMDMNRLSTATGSAFDLAFLDMMIPHHEGALSMAKEALDKAQHPELKTLAQNVIMAQETEIEQMQQWKQDWLKQQ